MHIAEYALTLCLILLVNFGLPRMMPGDPFLNAEDDLDQPFAANLTTEQVAYFRAYYGLDKPLSQQFIGYFCGLLHGDMGYSIQFKESVRNMIFSRLPWTLFMVLASLLLSCLLGSWLGCISALHRTGSLDKALYTGMVLFSELPSFVVGLVLLFVFSVQLRWFPMGGGLSPFVPPGNPLSWLADAVHHAVLPVLALTVSRLSGFYLLARNSMMTVLSKDYVRTAWAKGLGAQRVLWGHALRNAMLPIITRVFLSLGGLFGGAVLVENVFAYPGLGALMGTAVGNRDYVLLQGVFLFMSFLVLSMNALADVLCRKLDPRLA